MDSNHQPRSNHQHLQPGCERNGDGQASPDNHDAFGTMVDGETSPRREPGSTVLQAAPGAQPPATIPLIVGIGASAGGLEALEDFFDAMPADSGLAFVVVQHLSPDFKSVMDELLARHTQITIHRVVDGMRVEANSIYLIPPKKELIISGCRLLLSDKDPELGLTLPIDIFFRSLAQDAGERAVGVILSGTGSDGSRGIHDIKAAGGFVIAQDLDSAKFDGMPKSAIATGDVDLILRPDQMPAALLSYIDHPAAAASTVLPNDPALLDGFGAICQLLRKSYDIDFSYYKRTTVARRVQRRLLMNQITDLEEYVARLRNDTHELNMLYKDLLIGVTKFFRDAEAFARIERDVVPELIAKARHNEELRIWVAGCATGEEAYSLAILIHEQLETAKQPLKAKIFATDVHPASLTVASAGTYSEASLSDVSPQRLERYFTHVKTGYQVTQELRQLVVFAPHNIIKDAPFTKLDLITCRNLLIYLEPAAQKKVLSLFHFALNTGGTVVLGPSESPGELADEFTPIDDRWKIYRKRRDKRLSADLRLPLSIGNLQTRQRRGINPMAAVPTIPDAPLLRVYDEMLKEFAPPSLLINDRRELVQSFSGAAEFLKLRDGRPSTDVFELVLPDLKAPLSTAVQQAAKKQSPITLTGIRVARPHDTVLIKVTVRPISDHHSDGEHFLVTLEPITDTKHVPPDRVEATEIDLSQASKDQCHSLEMELRYTKENLQATVEEMETSNEELQATNEELVASNEELQSTNEELHSVNEELYTVNAEYQKKISELTELTSDMDNLLYSTEVGVIFLDPDLCIRKFTPKIAEVFHLLPLDIGRRIDSFSHNIHRAELLEDMKRVLRDKTPFETEVRVAESLTFLLRILPYRSKSQIEGIVLTLIDISQLKRAETALLLMSKVFVDGSDPIIIEDLEGRITDVNAEALRTFGWDRHELLGKSVDVLIPQDERMRARELRSRCLEKGGLRNVETWNQNRRGERIPVLLTLSVLTNQSGHPVALASGVKDITERRRAEQLARDGVQKRDQFLAMLSHELRNPLGAALNATYALDHVPENGLPGEVKDVCRVIQRQTLQVSRLLDDLLDVSRITQGRIQIRREVLDLAQLLDDAVHAIRPQIDERGHRLVVDVAPGPVFVDGDASRLLQIIENLLANAAKYTSPGGQLRLSLTKEDGEAVLRVADNGNGIPPHMLESIFEMFVQGEDTLDRTQGGMGIGLTLVRTLVNLHGGQVAAYSSGLGQGSEFVVRLPLAAAPAANFAEGNGAAVQDPGPKRLVLVEDNDDSREMLQKLLQLDGHQVSAAKDGSQGLEMILNQSPDAAIIDIGLPGLSGYDVAQEVRRKLRHGNVCLIALTGYGRAEDRDAAYNAGFDAHLVKPLKPSELAQILGQRIKPRDSTTRNEMVRGS